MARRELWNSHQLKGFIHSSIWSSGAPNMVEMLWNTKTNYCIAIETQYLQSTTHDRDKQSQGQIKPSRWSECLLFVYCQTVKTNEMFTLLPQRLLSSYDLVWMYGAVPKDMCSGHWPKAPPLSISPSLGLAFSTLRKVSQLRHGQKRVVKQPSAEGFHTFIYLKVWSTPYGWNVMDY